MGESQSESASQDMASSSSTAMQSGSSDMASDTQSGADIDTTVTAGVSGSATGSFETEGFYQIPVDMVMSDCRTTPDAKVSDILDQHSMQ